MANHRYPATPSFGGAFPGGSFSSPQMQRNGYSVSAERPPSTFALALQLSTTANPQYLNTSNFDTNNQIPSPAASLPPLPSRAFPPELLKHLVNSTLPPPPPPTLPPVPIPNLGFSPYHPPAPLPSDFALQPYQASKSTENHNSVNPAYTDQHSVFEPRTETISAGIAAREEGELSDGELEDGSAAGTSPTASREGSTWPQPSLRGGLHPSSQPSGFPGTCLLDSCLVTRSLSLRLS